MKHLGRGNGSDRAVCGVQRARLASFARTRVRLVAAAPLVLAALAPVAAAQSAGALVGTPATVLVGPGTASSTIGMLSGSELYRKAVGFVGFPVPGPAVDAPGDPVFTTTEMFGGGVAPPAFEVDALSLGLDVVPSKMPDLGVAEVDFMATGGWGTLLYSVSPGTQGTPGSLIAQEQAGAGGAAADLFSLMLPGSAIPPVLADCYPDDEPQRALDALEMELLGGDITSADVTMQLYQLGSPVKPAETSPVVYFSVAHDSVFPPGGGPSLVPPEWFDCGFPSGATVLRTRWIVSPADPMGGFWTQPRVHLSYDHLGLGLHDDIDALAVDAERSMLLFSIRRTPMTTLDQQLQVAGWPVDATTCADMNGAVKVGIYTVPSTDADGAVPVATHLGIGPVGEVDSVCVIDPATQTSVLAAAFGTPAIKVPGTKQLACGVYRDDDSLYALPAITVTVAGIPTVPPSGTVKVELYLLVPGSVLQILSQPFATFGGLDHAELPLAHSLLGGPMPLNAVASFFWVVRQVAPGGLKLTSPVVSIDI
jgi:hypothetical protein